MTEQIWIGLIGLLGGSAAQHLISTKFMAKKEKRDADQEFIDTLLQRIYNLEGRLDELSKQLTSVMTENAMLKVELDYIKKENKELKKDK